MDIIPSVETYMKHLKAILLPAVFLAGLVLGLPAGISYTPSMRPGATSGSYAATVDAKLDLAWLLEAKTSTVAVYAPDGGHGSGVIVGRSLEWVTALTAAHVIEGFDTFTVYYASGDLDFKAPAVLVKVCEDCDLATVRFRDPAHILSVMPIADLDPGIGSLVIAIGYPGPVYPAIATIGYFKDVEPGYTLHSAGIWFGNSGGPLFNSKGQLIGINVRIQAREHLDSWDSGGGIAVSLAVLRAFLGV